MIYKFQSTITFLLFVAIALTIVGEEPQNILLRFGMWLALLFGGFTIAMFSDSRRKWK